MHLLVSADEWVVKTAVIEGPDNSWFLVSNMYSSSDYILLIIYINIM